MVILRKTVDVFVKQITFFVPLTAIHAVICFFSCYVDTHAT